VAAYLRGDGEQASASAKILERLAQPVETKQVQAPQAAPTPVVNDAKLEALTRAEDASAKQSEAADRLKPGHQTSEKEADLGKANEKLSSLLGKPK
jgi:hypothetical protein